MTERLDAKFEDMATAPEPAAVPTDRHWGRKIAAITALAGLGLGMSACGNSHEGGEPTGGGQPTVINTNTPGSEQSPSGEGSGDRTKAHERTEPAGTVVLDLKGYIKPWPEYGSMSADDYSQLFPNVLLKESDKVKKAVAKHPFVYRVASASSDTVEAFSQNPFKHSINDVTDAKTVGNYLHQTTELLTSPHKLAEDAVKTLHATLPPEQLSPETFPSADEINQLLDKKDALGLYKALTRWSKLSDVVGYQTAYLQALLDKYEPHPDQGDTGRTYDEMGDPNRTAVGYDILSSLPDINDMTAAPYYYKQLRSQKLDEAHYVHDQSEDYFDNASPSDKLTPRQKTVKYIKKQLQLYQNIREQYNSLNNHEVGAQLLQFERKQFGGQEGNGVASLTFLVEHLQDDSNGQKDIMTSLVKLLVVPAPVVNGRKDGRLMALWSRQNIIFNDPPFSYRNLSDQEAAQKVKNIVAKVNSLPACIPESADSATQSDYTSGKCD